MIDMKERRTPATVVGVFYGEEDHGVLTAYVRLEFGGEQGFGGLCLDERTGPEFKKRVVELFSSQPNPASARSAWENIVGRSCFVLRCWGELNTPIDGLEVEGKRFLISKFRREMWPERQFLSEFEQKQARIVERIAWAARCIHEGTEKLAALKDEYYDWENAP